MIGGRLSRVLAAVVVVGVAGGWLWLRPGAVTHSLDEPTRATPDPAIGEAAARKLAALSLQEQPPETQARYYQSRIATAQHALQVQREALAASESAMSKTTELSAEAQAAWEVQAQRERVLIAARTSQIEGWQRELGKLAVAPTKLNSAQ